MKNCLLLFLTLLIISTMTKAQTRVKAHETPKPRSQKTAKPTAERIAARAQAKLDSIQQVRALAKELARQMVVEDSVRKVQQLAAQQAKAKSAVAYQPLRRHSQDGYSRGLSIGFRGSLNLNTMNISDDIGEVGYLSTPGGAFVFSIPLGNNPFALQLEPGYAERGVKYKLNEVSSQYRVESQGTIRLQYLELPVLFRLQPSIGPLQVILTAGPEVRYLLGVSESSTSVRYAVSTGKTISTHTDEGRIDPNEFNRFDLGLTGGIGVGIPLSFGQMFVDGRYHFGTMNFLKDDEGTAHNRAISINAGVLISLH